MPTLQRIGPVLKLLAVAILALPHQGQAQLTLNWGPAPADCDNGNVNCQAPLLLDGQSIGFTTSAGSMSFGALDDGEGHVVTLKSVGCGGAYGALDDFGTISASVIDCSEPGSCASAVVATFSLGDDCGGGDTAEIPVSGARDDSKPESCDGHIGSPVSFIDGQMTTVPQTDFVIEDPFFPVRFTRTYASSPPYDGVLGWAGSTTSTSSSTRSPRPAPPTSSSARAARTC